ncbi:MAG: D-alanyl-D-alanine carboxypeptidase family protein [Halieaceae bacterium]|jgi:D-alanyl-D-alanine carboxypeptidase (penicillin-binding protein 5/6)|nr:D-alanyl-D-alanine carboxypeptidase family protein [Halieaceae bacterium]
MKRFSLSMIRSCSPVLALLATLVLSVAMARAAVLPPPPDVAGSAWILADADTGYVITENNADERLAPASLTKLMTSYVLASELAAGRVSNDDVVQVSENAWAQNPLFAGSSLMWIEPGKPVSLLQLHRGVVISSGNDASVAIAEHVAGSESAFADMMNAHAKELGMTGTHFVNSHGLPDPDHYTTARDLVLLADALIERFPEEYALYKEREYTYNNIRQYNRNALLAEDPSVDGLKTGHTEEAGYCLVASAERNGMRLISVVLGADSERSRKAESRKLLNYGFRTFETLSLYSAGEELATTRVWMGLQESLSLGVDRTIRMTIPRGGRDDLDAAMEIDKVIKAPVMRGDTHGALVVKLNGETLLNEPLVALEAIEPAGFFARLWDSIQLFFIQLFGN